MKCSNTNCTEATVVCKACGYPSKDNPNKLICQLCHIGQQSSDDEDGDEYDSLDARNNK